MNSVITVKAADIIEFAQNTRVVSVALNAQLGSVDIRFNGPAQFVVSGAPEQNRLLLAQFAVLTLPLDVVVTTIDCSSCTDDAVFIVRMDCE